MQLNATYADGLSADSEDLKVIFSAHGILFPSGKAWSYGGTQLVAKVKKTGKIVFRHDDFQNARLSVYVPEAQWQAFLDYLRHQHPRLIGRVNSDSMRWQSIIAVSIVVTLAAIYFLYPHANRILVSLMPTSWAETAGEMVIDHMYGGLNRGQQCAKAEGQALLDRWADELAPEGTPYDIKVRVARTSEINAFAAPGGQIVILKGLIDKADGPDEVAGVLAHEIGHAYHKHPMQGLVSALGLGIISQIFGGDAGTVATLVLSSSYSRDAERQADQTALDILYDQGISAEGFIEFFRKIKDLQGKYADSELFQIVASHPLTSERIEHVEDHIHDKETDKGLTFKASATDEEWQALKNICD